MILKYFIKSLMGNRALWFWGVLYVLIWLLLGAFVFSANLTASRAVVLPYASAWFGIFDLLSFASLTVSIAYTIYFGSSSLSYSFRYTRLRPLTYFLSLLAASSVMGITMSAILLFSAYAAFSYRFHLNLQPSQPLAALALSALAGAFMMVFAVAIVLIAVNYAGLKNINFMSFIPMILAYVFGFGQLYINIPAAVQYASPFNDIISLLFASYSGLKIPVSFKVPQAGFLDWRILLVSLLFWIILLSFADLMLIKRIRPRAIEEMRQL